MATLPDAAPADKVAVFVYPSSCLKPLSMQGKKVAHPPNPKVPRCGRSAVAHVFAGVRERHGAATFWNFDRVDSENAQLIPSSGKRPDPGRPQLLTTRRNVIASRTNALAMPISSGRRKIVNSDE